MWAARRRGMQNGKQGELSGTAPEHFNTKAYARQTSALKKLNHKETYIRTIMYSILHTYHTVPYHTSTPAHQHTRHQHASMPACQHTSIPAYQHTNMHTYLHAIHTVRTIRTMHTVHIHNHGIPYHTMPYHTIGPYHYTHTYKHRYTHTYIYIYINMYIYINVHTCIHAYMRTCADIHTYIQTKEKCRCKLVSAMNEQRV